MILALVLFTALCVDGAKGGFRCKDQVTTPACLAANYSKFELPITEGVNEIFVSIDIDEVKRKKGGEVNHADHDDDRC